MKKATLIFVLCLFAAGCEKRTVGPAEEILRNGYIDGGLTMWAYDVREKPIEIQRRIMQSLLDDESRIFDAYLLIGCTNQAQFSRLSDKFSKVISEISTEITASIRSLDASSPALRTAPTRTADVANSLR